MAAARWIALLAVTALAVAVSAEIPHVPPTRALTIILKAGERRCFMAHARKLDDRIMIGFQVRSGHTDFDMEVLDPKMNTVFYSASAEHDSENRLFFTAQHTGEYTYCLDNSGHSRSEKVIAIQLATSSGAAKSKRADPLVRSLRQINAHARALLNDQVHLRAREREHRETLESNNTRVLWRSVLEIGAMLAMSVGQVYYLRSLFARKASRSAA
jgi:p24 family protein beta-1